MDVTVVKKPGVARSNSYYPCNHEPLVPNPLVRLPLGSVRARGWLLHQLDLMVDGMVGRLSEVSTFLADGNGWLGGDKPGWEEQPYWLRGFYPMAALTGDERCLELANRWIEAVLASQQDDGYFGPVNCREIRTKDGRLTVPDLWPHMVMIDALILHHEATGDERIIPLLEKFFAFCRDLPEESFIPPECWDTRFEEFFDNWFVAIQAVRSGDMIPHIHWLYNQTGDDWLLDLAGRFFRHTQPPKSEWLHHHVVHFTQQFAYAGLFFAQSKRDWHLDQVEFWYAQHMATWGQQPRGAFGADENVRPGKVDPRQAIETCAMVEFAKNFYLLGRITGDTLYADRCEDVMLNHFPASQSPDLTALHYLTASNQVQLDMSEQHDYDNKGVMIPYSPHERYRCCQHNVAMGWPWYVQNLWQATADDGLAAWLYGASEVTAKVGQGAEVTLTEETDYPFRGIVLITVGAAEPVAFPLYLRVPRWCEGFGVTVNGSAVDAAAEPGSYVRIEREWADGDTVEIAMPMAVERTTWPRTGSATVDRGPLSYSVRIDEDWKVNGGTDEWPEWEVFPKSPWNYGLVDGETFEVIEKDMTADQPWTPDAAPVEIKVRAKRIDAWQIGEDQTVPPLQMGPIKSDAPDETITMIPLGCARLRLACLPVMGDGPDARPWTPWAAASGGATKSGHAAE